MRGEFLPLNRPAGRERSRRHWFAAGRGGCNVFWPVVRARGGRSPGAAGTVPPRPVLGARRPSPPGVGGRGRRVPPQGQADPRRGAREEDRVLGYRRLAGPDARPAVAAEFHPRPRHPCPVVPARRFVSVPPPLAPLGLRASRGGKKAVRVSRPGGQKPAPSCPGIRRGRSRRRRRGVFASTSSRS